MKSILVALMLVVSSSAMAASLREDHFRQDDYRSQEDVAITYVSWCEKNNVVSQDSEGNTYIRSNCSEQHQTCQASTSYRAQGVIYSAACVK